MYKIWISICMVFWSLSLVGQIGVRLGSSHSEQNLWTGREQPIRDLSPVDMIDLYMAIDYRRCLRNTRLEFYPGLRYDHSLVVKPVPNNPSSYKLRYQSMFIGFNTHAYIFDLKGNCNGSTGNRYGSWFRKGFYLRIGGESGLRVVEILSLNQAENISAVDFIARVNFGFGMDLGISETVTLSPNMFLAREMYLESTGSKGKGQRAWARGAEIRLSIELN